jgi:AraC family transcriptional regulator
VFEQEYRDRINRVVRVIIREPSGHWTTQALADLAGLSAFHFHRIFRALTGETMFAFLQRRRLLRAIELINQNGSTLTDIALECGFDSGSSLSRAFRRHFRCSPTQYRKQLAPLPLPPPRLGSNHINSLRVAIRETLPRKAVIVERRGMVDQNFNKAAAAAFRVLSSEIKRVNCWHAIRECIGRCPDEAAMAPDSEARYQAGFFYEDRLPALSAEVRRITIPGGRWAVSLHQGSYETLWQSWNRLYRYWLPASAHAMRDVAPFEIYLDDKKKVPPEKLRTEIWIPIQ